MLGYSSPDRAGYAGGDEMRGGHASGPLKGAAARASSATGSSSSNNASPEKGGNGIGIHIPQLPSGNTSSPGAAGTRPVNDSRDASISPKSGGGSPKSSVNERML